MRFICANRISTFFRSRRDCWKGFGIGERPDAIAHILFNVSCGFRVGAVLHFGFNKQAEQSCLLAL
jgi:hypothetical protein